MSPSRASAFLDLALSPSGRLRLTVSDAAIDIEPAQLARLTHAFERGSGEGLVQLGGAELEGQLPPALGWFREFGHLFFTALCALPDLDLPGAVSNAPPSPDFDELARSVAPMLGGEYLTAAVLESLWGATWDALSARASERRESVIEVVRGLSSAWHGVGRVVFHLAENLWSLFDFLNPGLLGSSKAFTQLTKRLAKAPGGYAPLRELVRPYILRRLKTDPKVITDLPPKTELTAYAGLTRAQATLYQQAVKDLERDLKRSAAMARRGLVLASLLRLKQICNHPSQWLGDGDYAEKSSGKLLRLRELCETIAERQERVLIFTQFRELCAPLAGFLNGVFGRDGLTLHGGTAVKARSKLVEQFQAVDGPPFFVLSLKAGGTGLNLTAASHVIHFDRWWNPAASSVQA